MTLEVFLSRRYTKTALSVVLLGGFALSAACTTHSATIHSRLMETTDLRMHALNFDYYRNSEVDNFGLARTATLIRDARAEARNSLLFDNGDLLQGYPMGDYMARSRGLSYGEVHPMLQAMNLLGYDAANIGNHELNYWLDFLLKSLAGADFPYVPSNGYTEDGDNNAEDDKYYIQPYVILDRQLMNAEGTLHSVKVGVFGFTPPQVVSWDKGHLDGQITVRGIVETAEAMVPMMHDAGAELIVAISHSGIAESHPDGFKENATAELSKVADIDAIMSGHGLRRYFCLGRTAGGFDNRTD